MARPIKKGVDYFPLDVDISSDDKIRLIEAEFGLEGFAIIIKLLCKIYSEGYYYRWSEAALILFSSDVHLDKSRVQDIIDACVKWGIFDERLYYKYKVLTSEGIQERYFGAIKRRVTEVVSEYLLVDISSGFSNLGRITQTPPLKGGCSEQTLQKLPQTTQCNGVCGAQTQFVPNKRHKGKESKVNIFSSLRSENNIVSSSLCSSDTRVLDDFSGVENLQTEEKLPTTPINTQNSEQKTYSCENAPLQTTSNPDQKAPIFAPKFDDTASLIPQKYIPSFRENKCNTGEIRAVSENQEKNAGNEKAEKQDKTPYDDIVKSWNAICTSMPKIAKLTTKRKQAMKLRWEEISKEAEENGEEPMEFLKSIFFKMQSSKFLRGEKPNSTWIANIDWFVRNDSNWVGVMEGKYSDRPKTWQAVTDSSEGNTYRYVDPSEF